MFTLNNISFNPLAVPSSPSSPLVKNGSPRLEPTPGLFAGLNFNNSGEYPATGVITQRLDSILRGLDLAKRKGLDGVGALQLAQAGVHDLSDTLRSMRELASRAREATLRPEVRAQLNGNYLALAAEFRQQVQGARLNGLSLFSDEVEQVDLSLGEGLDPDPKISLNLRSTFVGPKGEVSGSLKWILAQIEEFQSAQAAPDTVFANLASPEAAEDGFKRVAAMEVAVSGLRAAVTEQLSSLRFNVDSIESLSAQARESKTRLASSQEAEEVKALAESFFSEFGRQALALQANQGFGTVRSLLDANEPNLSVKPRLSSGL